MNRPDLEKATLEVLEELKSLSKEEFDYAIKNSAPKDDDLDIHSPEFLRQT